MRISITVMGLLAGLAGCGGAGAQGGATVGAADPDAIPSPPTPWAEMDHASRQRWMYTEVLPRMEARFSDYDATRYADFSCETCHGPSPAERRYAMPSLALPALPPTGSPEQHAMVREYPGGVRFMFSSVLPAMQTLVGAPDFDEATGEGFSCYSCHPHQGDEGSTLIHLETVAPDDEANDDEANDDQANDDQANDDQASDDQASGEAAGSGDEPDEG